MWRNGSGLSTPRSQMVTWCWKKIKQVSNQVFSISMKSFFQALWDDTKVEHPQSLCGLRWSQGIIFYTCRVWLCATVCQNCIPWPPKHDYWDINWFALAGVLIALSCSFWCPASNTRTSIIQQFLYFAPLLCFRYLGSAGRSILTLPLLATRLTFSKQSILDVSFYSDSRM